MMIPPLGGDFKLKKELMMRLQLSQVMKQQLNPQLTKHWLIWVLRQKKMSLKEY